MAPEIIDVDASDDECQLVNIKFSKNKRRTIISLLSSDEEGARKTSVKVKSSGVKTVNRTGSSSGSGAKVEVGGATILEFSPQGPSSKSNKSSTSTSVAPSVRPLVVSRSRNSSASTSKNAIASTSGARTGRAPAAPTSGLPAVSANGNATSSLSGSRHASVGITPIRSSTPVPFGIKSAKNIDIGSDISIGIGSSFKNKGKAPIRGTNTTTDASRNASKSIPVTISRTTSFSHIAPSNKISLASTSHAFSSNSPSTQISSPPKQENSDEITGDSLGKGKAPQKTSSRTVDEIRLLVNSIKTSRQAVSTSEHPKKRPAQLETHDIRPLKRANLTHDVLPSLTMAHRQSTTVAKRKREEDFIIIDDSSDEEAEVAASLRSKKSRREATPREEMGDTEMADVQLEEMPDKETLSGSESDSDWDNCHAGYHMSNGRSWTEPSQPLWVSPDSEDEDEMVSSLREMSVADNAPEPQVSLYQAYRKKIRIKGVQMPKLEGPWPWNNLLHPDYRFPPRRRSGIVTALNQMRMTGSRTRALPQYVGAITGLENLVKADTFRYAPGSINKIIQAKGTVISCSAVSGGAVDDDGEAAPSPTSNRDGALAIWRDGATHKLHAHRRNWDGSDSLHKYYTVNDIQFDPSVPRRTKFASSGNDGVVYVWDLDQFIDDESQGGRSCSCINNPEHKHPFVAEYTFDGSIPRDITYRPGQHQLAVACNDATVVVLRNSDDEDRESLRIDVSSKPDHSTGAMLWGQEATPNMIFASSEAPFGAHEGVHVACDVIRSKSRMQFDATECGDAMALDPLGKTLALFTEGESYKRLRLYDVQNKIYRRPMRQIDLEPFHDSRHDEVNSASFSSDGVYLSVARSDDSVHVYDSRYLDRGPLYKFKHKGESRSMGKDDVYGITAAHWVESQFGRRLSLATGGTDGCVRLWDILKSPDDRTNGKIIADSDYNIGHFSVGETAEGDMPLVLGDCGGNVSMFDRSGRPRYGDC